MWMGPAEHRGMCRGPARRSAGETSPLAHGQASPVESLMLSLGSHPLDTLQPPSLQLMTQRGEPLQQHPAQVGKLSTHAHTLLCPTGVINHRLRRALGSEQCHLGEGWHRSSQIVPLFLSTESSIEMFCSSELLEFLFWKSRPPQMCPPPWVIV